MGAAIAKIFYENGEKLIIVGRNQVDYELNIASLEKNKNQRIKFIKSDLDDPSSIERIIAELKERKLVISKLIYNYGGTVGSRNIHDDFDGWQLCLWKNVYFSARFNSEILKLEQLCSALSRIIHVSSASARHLMGAQTYATAKALLNAYVATSGRQLAKKGIVQLAVAPGALDTTQGPWKTKSEEQLKDFLDHYQFCGHLGDEDTIAKLIFALSGEAGNFCHGNIIDCDGGSV